MDRTVLWRAALVQALSVAAIAVVLAVALPKSFFESWGWLAGPAVWAACALVTARVVGLPWLGTLIGAALAGVPALVGVISGVHWLGTALGIVVFALWCGRLARERALAAHPVEPVPHAARPPG
jgi:hypothetical protein